MMLNKQIVIVLAPWLKVCSNVEWHEKTAFETKVGTLLIKQQLQLLRMQSAEARGGLTLQH